MTLLIVALALCGTQLALADGSVMVPTAAAPPEWLGAVLQFVSSLPYAGPVIVALIKWAGLVAGIMTALSVFAQAVLAVPELVARWAGANEAAEKIRKISDVVLPWLKWLSVFNVQKKPQA